MMYLNSKGEDGEDSLHEHGQQELPDSSAHPIQGLCVMVEGLRVAH